MRVVLVHNRYRIRGGEEITVQRQRASLEAAGHTVRSFEADNRRLETWAQKVWAGVRTGWSQDRYDELRALLQAFTPDVGHVHNWFPQLTPAVYQAFRDTGIPVVQTLHNYRLGCAAGTYLRKGVVCMQCRPGANNHALRARCYRGSLPLTWAWSRAMRRAWDGLLQGVDAFVAPSSTVAQRHVAMGLPPERIHVIPHAVPDPIPHGKSAPPLCPTQGALFVGRLSPEKGVDVLIDAWRDIAAPLKIVGDGPVANALRHQARANDCIEFLGPLPQAEVQRLISRSAFLVLPHRWWEPFGLVVLEAQAWGRPVITSDLGGPAEIVEPDQSGLLVPAGSPAALRAAACKLLTQPKRLAALSRGARANYLGSFTPARQELQLQQLYRRLRAQRLPCVG